MTRKEQIEQIKQKKLIEFLDSCGTMDNYQYPERCIGYEIGFQEGADWADATGPQPVAQEEK